ncbi:hypothetical protein C8F01DRAFT_1163505 [Mycena amicta]|nr:hypothetical protein C8F01DRAFT_1163505 [Mycena amicta]
MSLRRSARKPKPIQRETTPPVVEHAPTKRKAKEDAGSSGSGSAERLVHLLQNSKSPLTKMEVSDVINANVWNMLSLEAQTRLAALLPATAFRTLIPSVFTDPHFLAAARTFQDHLFSNWFSDAHTEKLQKYVEGTTAGTLAAPWKDEASVPFSEIRAGDAADIKLVDLVKNSVICEGDVLAYKRKFTALGLVVEKDVIIQRVDSRTGSITILVEPGVTRDLPPSLVQPGSAEPPGATRTMTIASPTQLETGLLDIDGRVERSARPNGNAWKALTVWRWSGDEWNGGGRRGGRQDHGTLFYLRACHYQDR